MEQNNLHPLELGLDAPELLDEQVAVVLRVEVAQILAHGVQADDAELTPKKRLSHRDFITGDKVSEISKAVHGEWNV